MCVYMYIYIYIYIYIERERDTSDPPRLLRPQAAEAALGGGQVGLWLLSLCFMCVYIYIYILYIYIYICVMCVCLCSVCFYVPICCFVLLGVSSSLAFRVFNWSASTNTHKQQHTT